MLTLTEAVKFAALKLAVEDGAVIDEVEVYGSQYTYCQDEEGFPRFDSVTYRVTTDDMTGETDGSQIHEFTLQDCSVTEAANWIHLVAPWDMARVLLGQ